MKKSIVAVLLVFSVALAPALAENTFSIGVNTGTETGVGARWQSGGFDLMGHFGWENYKVSPFTLGGDLQGSYRVATIAKGHSIEVPLTLGLGISTDVDMNGLWNISANVPVGFEYALAEVPMTIYLRVAPGVRFYSDGAFDCAFSCKVYAGGLWCFDGRTK